MTDTPVPEDDAYSFASDLHARTRGGGLTFHERLSSARSASPHAVLDLTAELPSLERFLADPAHRIPMRGTVSIAGLATRATVSGTLSLFPEEGGDAMVYTPSFQDDAGGDWRLSGTKTTGLRTPRQLLSALTRLDCALTHHRRVAGPRGRVRGPGGCQCARHLHRYLGDVPR